MGEASPAPNPLAQKEIYEFGTFRLDVAEHSLRDAGRQVSLKPKVFETLVLLVRNAGHLLSKQELLSALWPDAVVDETNLNKNIWLIRRALGDRDETSPYIETVPRVGYRFAAPVVRHADAEAQIAASIPSPPDDRQPVAVAPEPMPDGRRLPWRSIAVVAGILAAITAALLTKRSPHGPGDPGGAAPRRTISVLGFQNLSGHVDLDWVATALSEMVQAELSAGPSYRILAGESARHLRRQLALDSPASLSDESLAKLRRLSPVDLVVGGSYVTTDGPPGREAQIRIDVMVQDARNGETLSSVTETGDSSRLFDLVSSLGSRLRLALREPSLSSVGAEQARASLPRNASALQHYSEGLGRLQSSDALAARDLFARAVDEEPDFPLAHAALGRAYATLGYEEKARLELQQAFGSSQHLSREERLSVEGSYRAANKEWGKAIAIYQEIDRLSSGDLENGLLLARTEASASRPREALSVVERLHRLPPPAGNDPRIDLQEHRILMLTDVKAALEAAEHGLAESRARREPLLEAEALLCRSNALQALGRTQGAKEPVEQAARIFSQAGDAGGEARASHVLGNFRLDEGDMLGAAAAFRASIEAADRIGYVLQKAASIASLSRVASIQGDMREAERLVEEANSIWRAIPDRRQLPWGLNALGVLRAGAGRLDDAVALHREALKMCRENGDYGSYIHDGYAGLAAALLAQGKLDEAAAVVNEALEASRKKDDPSWTAQHLTELGQLDFERTRLDEAGRLYAEALDLRRKRQENYTVPESELLIARLQMEEGKGEEASKLALSASRNFAAAGRRSDQAAAEAAEAEALLTSGRSGEAARVAAAAGRLLDDKTPRDARIAVLLARVRVAEREGRADAGRSDLQTAGRLAREMGWKNLLFETRLAAAELDLSDGRSGAAISEAVSLASDARATGFDRIARHADRIANEKPR